MPTFTIDIRRTSLLSADVEADSPNEAARKVYEVLTEQDYTDSDDEITAIEDDSGNRYYEKADGTWAIEKRH